MTATHGVGTYGNAVGTVAPLDHKMAQLGLIVKTAANTIRAGVFWDGNQTLVSGKANMSYDVRALTAVLSRSATAGAVLLSNDAVYNVVTTAAPGSNSRYDVVYLWQREFSLDGTDSNPVIGVIQGTSAASPTVPSLAAFPGAIQLATILVPAGVTATNTGTTITQTAPFTAPAGGVVPFRNTTERDAGTYQKSQLGWLLDSDTLQSYNGALWVPLAGLACTVRKSANQNLTTSAAAIVWDVEISDPVGMHDNVTNNTRLIAPIAGLYEVTASVYNNNTTGMGTLQARLNGTTDIPGSLDRRTADATAALPLHITCQLVLSASDYVEIMVLHATAAGTIAGGITVGSAIATLKRIGPS